MKKLNRKLVILFKDGTVSELAMEKLIDKLDEMLKPLESVELFCQTHEMADGYNITQNNFKLKNIFNGEDLLPYCFIIGKN